ncbi:hypothetical protein [Glycomyces sp. YM15]|uniref:hypothetical protein n=1 Tax=Glycomyces sp. YM15 TaxID=2800446 RepID=UPI001965DD4A|nr:hypothetical protein [Glycomyces sp. YM15]
MTDNPSRSVLSRHIVLAASGASAVAGHLATAASRASAQEATAECEPVTYPVPEGIAQNTSFDARVRVPGGLWEPLGVTFEHP